MYYKSRKLQYARSRIVKQLKAMGWQERPCREPFRPNDGVNMMASYKSPRICDGLSEFEFCLKKFDTGEAYWWTESEALELAHLAWRCHLDNPNNHHPLDTYSAFVEARQMMLKGIDFEYEDYDVDGQINHETILIIDWEQPERNTFEYVVGWRGARNDGFAWDVVLLVNSIPIGGILLASPEGAGVVGVSSVAEVHESLPCQNAYNLAFEQLSVDYQFPVYCHSLIIGNGKQLMIGNQFLEIEEFMPIERLEDVLLPIEFLMARIKHF